jgi:hypothetical protein
MRRLFWWLAGALIAIISPLHAGSLSGTWVASGPDIAVMLQLVDSGGPVVGRFEQVQIASGARLERMIGAVNGNTDGETIALSIKPTEYFSGSLALSGTISSDEIRLTGGGYGRTLNLRLSKASEETFNSQVANLSNGVARTNALSNMDADAHRLEKLIDQMKSFNMKAEDELKQFPSVETLFRTQTSAMTNALSKQQSIVTSDRTAVLRGQIGGAINQAAGQAYQTHLDFQSKHSEFESRSVALLKEAAGLYHKCPSPTASPSEEDPSAKTWSATCLKTVPIFAEFRNNATETLQAFDRVEAVWQAENRKQQSIVRSSDIAAR